MKLISLKINGFKNLNTEIDFTKSEGISVFVGNNGSGKSNVLEAISAIFYGLYDETNAKRCNFTYELKYIIDGKEIFIKQDYDNIDGIETRGVGYLVDGKTIREISDFLPSKIIALYSGEEIRLYENYFFNEYDNYIESIVYGERVLEDIIKMNFVDRSFWNIALLTFAIFEDNSNYSEILGIPKVSSVKFFINKGIIDIFSGKIDNKIIEFLSKIDNEKDIKIDDLRKINNIEVYEDFYKMLVISSLIKKDKYRILDYIDVRFEEFSSDSLSEGQKKQILIYFVTEILADKDSIILLDEPDSYIHVGNKKRLKEFFDNFLDIREEGEFIMTTHSPTLMHNFGDKHLFYLENGSIIGNDKAKILKKITGDLMSFTEQQIVLNTNKDILIVEGKTDEIVIKEALTKLKVDNKIYKNLEFEFIPAGGADGIKLFLDKFKLKKGQKIIIFFDQDDSGWKGLKNIIGEDDFKKINKEEYKYNKYKEKFLSVYPKKNGFTTKKGKGFVLEDYFNLKIFTDFLLKDIECFQDIPKKDKRKTDFANYCKELSKKEFEGFKVLFDLILKIKKED